jgi:hypothetical protein
VNKKVFIRLDVLGKGGSSRVFRVMNTANEIFAIKRVSLDKTDAETMNGYMNEIALLRRLDGNHRIIRLFDSEVKSGPGGTKGHLLLLMECGEIGKFILSLGVQRTLKVHRYGKTYVGATTGTDEFSMDIILLATGVSQQQLNFESWAYELKLSRCYKPCMLSTKKKSSILISNRQILC